MKKRTIIKLTVLILAVAIAATVFAGCVFVYDEDTDLSQVILDINSVDITYEVPLTEDYTDSNGNPVYKLNDGLDEYGNVADNVKDVRASDNFAKPTTEVVQTVKRTHDGAAIHKAKVSDGKAVYVGYVTTADGIKSVETTEGDENWQYRLQQETSDEYFVEPISGEEFRFEGIAYNGGKTAYAARWTKLSDGKSVYGPLAVNATQNRGDFEIDDSLPLINYDAANDSFRWTELTPAYETATYTTEKGEIFKSAMIMYFNNYAQNYVAQGYKNADDIFDRFINMFSTSYLARQEAIAAIKSGNAEWGVTEINAVNKAIYDAIDDELNSIYSEISLGRGEDVPEISPAETPSPTYPTPPSETDEDVRDYEVWNVAQTPERIPGNDANPARASYERAAVRKLVDDLEDYVEDQYAMNDEDRETYRKEVEEMSKIVEKDEGIPKLYASLYTYKIIRLIFGDATENQLQLEAIRNYMGRDVESDDVQTVYNEQLSEQRSNFDSNIQSYYTACGNNDTILYFADEEYFWVKHILIPLSDAQQASLEAEKQRGKSDEEVEAYRENLGKNVVVYKHKDGENDTSKTYTIDEAYDEISAVMSAAASSPTEALTKFDELIYVYNTDPGIFDNEMGYAVTKTPALNGGATETYMIEFATAARELYARYKAGEGDIGMISEPVMTDYGWHILCLNYVPQAGQIRSINEYLTAANQTTVGEALAVDNYNTKLNAKFNAWQDGISEEYRAMDGIIVPHKERFKSRLKEYEENLFGNDD